MQKHTDVSPEQTRFEKIPTRIFQSSASASQTVAREIADLIRAKTEKGEPCVLGLATGSTPTSVYGELVRLHREEGLSFRNVITFNLDEYYPMQPGALQSYVRFMHEYLFDHVDILPENINIPDGTVPKEQIARFCAVDNRLLVRTNPEQAIRWHQGVERVWDSRFPS